jgi:hypothetical protein
LLIHALLLGKCLRPFEAPIDAQPLHSAFCLPFGQEIARLDCQVKLRLQFQKLECVTKSGKFGGFELHAGAV